MDIFKEVFVEQQSVSKIGNQTIHRIFHIRFGPTSNEVNEIKNLLKQLANYDEVGHNTDFTKEEREKINVLVDSEDLLNIELARQIILERLNNH